MAATRMTIFKSLVCGLPWNPNHNLLHSQQISVLQSHSGSGGKKNKKEIKKAHSNNAMTWNCLFSVYSWQTFIKTGISTMTEDSMQNKTSSQIFECVLWCVTFHVASFFCVWILQRQKKTRPVASCRVKVTAETNIYHYDNQNIWLMTTVWHVQLYTQTDNVGKGKRR